MTEQQAQDTITSAAAWRGPLAMQATSIGKDFRLGRGQTLHAVRDASFSLYSGAVVALVGESGSGKSTAARMLAGQENLTSGQIQLDGKDIRVASRRDFRHYKSQVQYVFQDPFASLNPVHTVRYHLERPVKLHQGKDADVGTEVVALMEQVRLTPARQFLVKYPHELSGGQRQRVSFARALAARPSVLLADEPVSMLDVSIRLEMLSLLNDLRQRLKLAMLYITHDIASARYFADEVLVMYAGEIVERGPAEEVTQTPAHPYTQLLVASAPDPDNLGSTLRRGAARSPAAASNGATANGAGGAAAQVAQKHDDVPTTGCPFSPRCPFADDRCRQEDPALLRISATRGAACWHLDVAAPELVSGLSGGGRTTPTSTPQPLSRERRD
jgi:peptide/nickel transport system ATP-binding protein